MNEVGQNWRRSSSPDCRRFDTLLAEIPEGEARPWLDEHARQCPPCSSLLSDLKFILSESRSLPEVEPPATLWPRIREQLAAEGVIREKGEGRRRWLGFLQGPFLTPRFAGVVASVIVLVSLVAVAPRINWEGTGGPGEITQSTSGIRVSIIVPALMAMEESYRVEAAALPTDVTATSDICMLTLDKAIEECKRIIEEEPDNELAQDHLMLAYEQKVALLSTTLQWSATYGAP